MHNNDENRVPPEVADKIGFYVYKLIDPRDGQVFYIGKGCGNRIFSHVGEADDYREDDGAEDMPRKKLDRIGEIRASGLRALHIVVRHGLTSEEAHIVESVLIQEYANLTNVVAGYDTSSFGAASIEQLIERYSAETMVLQPDERVIAINVGVSVQSRELYDAVRFAWRVSPDRAGKANYVLAVTDGLCRGVFVADQPWIPATRENFPLLPEDLPRRYGFTGREASDDVKARFCGKRLPESLARRKGMVNPIMYNYD